MTEIFNHFFFVDESPDILCIKIKNVLRQSVHHFEIYARMIFLWLIEILITSFFKNSREKHGDQIRKWNLIRSL